jgi:hypothetical protein
MCWATWYGGLIYYGQIDVISENPNAVYMIVEQGADIFDWKGLRVCLKMKEYVTSGPKLDPYKSQAAKVVGEQTAAKIKGLATFEVTEVRPLVDFGQGWERSIQSCFGAYVYLGEVIYCIGSMKLRNYLTDHRALSLPSSS